MTWTKQTKKTSTWSKKDKSESNPTWSKKTKNTSTWTNKSKS